MNAWRMRVADYLRLRRSLGYDLALEDGRLGRFVAFLEDRNAPRITAKLAFNFAAGLDRCGPRVKAAYLSAVRGFAKYMVGFDSKTEIPPCDLFPRDPRRPRPYIYSVEEIQRLLGTARSSALAGTTAYKRSTVYCVLGLLAVTGMRVSEALALKPEDINWDEGLLTIQRTKFQKSRHVPLHASSVRQLRVYAKHRDAYLASLSMRTPPVRFFVTTQGMPCARNFVSVPFRRISRQIGLRARGARKGPRIHDLRHGFAVGTLLNWYRCGKKIDPLMPVLSTYLGHGCVAATYWYITCTPELMQSVGKRLEARWKGAPDADLN